MQAWSLDVILGGWTAFGFPSVNLSGFIAGVLQAHTVAAGSRIWQE